MSLDFDRKLSVRVIILPLLPPLRSNNEEVTADGTLGKDETSIPEEDEEPVSHVTSAEDELADFEPVIAKRSQRGCRSRSNVWAKTSVTSTTSEVRTEDLYCDDELNGDDPNLQLQIAQAASEQAAPAGDSAAHGANSGGMRSRYPPHPMLVDQG